MAVSEKLQFEALFHQATFKQIKFAAKHNKKDAGLSVRPAPFLA
jgi:hypothetical protein